MSNRLLNAIHTRLSDSEPRPIFVGYSGGLDSQVLLHALCQTQVPSQIIALHINHGISPQADNWQHHCQQRSLQLGCRFIAIKTTIEKQGQGLEAAARQARFQLFDEQVAPGHSLLLAHHLDDQLETFMLRLMRGSGLHGLSAMQPETQRQGYRLLRPFLAIPRSDLEAYAREHNLDWIEDESNTDTQFDRNYLRHEIFPRLAERWPQYRQTLNRSLTQLSQAAKQQDHQLEQELDHRLAHDGAFKAVQLNDWSEDRILSLIHLWLRRQNVRPPSEALMQRILNEVVRAQPDAQPIVQIGHGSVRRFRTALYWVPDLPEPGEPPKVIQGSTVHWTGVGALSLKSMSNGPNRIKTDAPSLNWRMRQGGETLWSAGRSKSRDLKRLLQEYRLPPWVRDRLPLLYSGDQLIAVADLCVDRDWQAQENEPGFVISYEPIALGN